MCGIAGIISTDPADVNLQRLKRMTDSIAHRGPQDEGFWIDETGVAGLGHRRLAILDLSEAGAQPMHFLQRYTITYNGEIYNYLEVRKELQKNGYAFSTGTDTEVILAAFDCYGSECLQHFDGMFAFAIWDRLTKKLFCARDRFGEKPFYYARQNGEFVFASEMKALWAAGCKKNLDDGMLLNYLGAGLLTDARHPSRTFYNEILTLPSASYMEVQFVESSDRVRLIIEVTTYWDLDKESTSAISEKDAADTLLQLLNISIRRRLRSDVPTGTSLSGGLDSSTIVSLIHQHYANTPQYSHAAFSALFPGFKNDESTYINEVVRQYKLKSFLVIPEADEFLKDFEKLVYHQEEPFQSSSIYAQYKVYELAAQNQVTVLLDGQGADEMLAGYHRYYHWYWQELLAAKKWKEFRSEKSDAGGLSIKEQWSLKNYIAAFLPAYAARRIEKNTLNLRRRQADLHPDFVKSNLDKVSILKPVVDKLNDILYFNTMHVGLGELLRYADRNSMAHSREVRLPFLSHELVQFIFSLPAHFKIRKGWSKWILRQSMDKQLPENIVWRKDKVGFEPPQQQWFQAKEMTELVHEQKRKLVAKGILKKTALNKPIIAADAHAEGNYDWRYLCAGYFI